MNQPIDEPSEGAPDPDSIVKHRKQLLGAVDFSTWSSRLARFMASQSGFPGDVEISDIRLPSAGGSSGTLIFSATYNQGTGRLKRDFVLRYATEGGLFHSYNLPGQYSILEALQGTGVPVPGIAGIDADGKILGVIGYVMERVDGDTAPSSYHKLGLFCDASPENRKRMVFEIVAALTKLHALDYRAPGLAFLLKRGKGATALERDLDWHWSSLCWGCPNEMANLEPIRQWLLQNQPRETQVALNHGDTMMANYMFKDGRLVAILDWELAFIGNPAADLAHQVQTHAFLALGGEALAGFPSEQEWIAEYARASGRKLLDWEYFGAVAAFKLHIDLLLVYREVTPDMEAARNAVRAYTWQNLTDRLAAAKNGRR